MTESVSGERVGATYGSAGGEWLCCSCYTRVANESDRLRIEGRDEFNFANPSGVLFNLITFSTTAVCAGVRGPDVRTHLVARSCVVLRFV